MSIERDHHVLVFAPIGRDGPAAAELFRSSGLAAINCRNLSELVSEMTAGVGAVFVAEEGLFGQDTAPLGQWIAGQPPWSDLPFVILTSHREQPAVVAWRRSIVALLRNVSLLERPVQPMTLTSAIQSAMRARDRQYEIRALLAAREQTAQKILGQDGFNQRQARVLGRQLEAGRGQRQMQAGECHALVQIERAVARQLAQARVDAQQLVGPAVLFQPAGDLHRAALYPLHTDSKSLEPT